ncbi:hypothetical protein [Bradyrhizobium cenepequi]|uniref:hypothetical protein n=1 Tax=Bradyrhizobium cenepequi TaxID=2821403 RepID=UPI001CE39523|nr:hypothetical protein [Bradyrhizobium cenepequi]
MSFRATMLRAAAACFLTLPVAVARAEDIDTEHLFGFMIGTDIGHVGEREFQTETTGRFSRNGGRYHSVTQEFELEFVPARDIRVELGGAFVAHQISGVTGLDDRRQLAWQGLSLDVRYRFLNRETAPFGMTFAVEGHTDRVDETTAGRIRNFGTEFTLAFEREWVPNFLIAALNFTYEPEWTRFLGSRVAEQEATVGAAVGVMAQIRPGVFLGGEARYLRHYEGVGLNEFEGHALFIGPVAYLQLSESSRLTATWSVQAWGRPAGSAAALDLVNFERHQARLVFGMNF